MGMNDMNSLSHTRWNCKYHIVFAPKYRRKVFYKEKRAAIGKILRQLCEWKGVKIIESEACPDHIHLFVEISYCVYIVPSAPVSRVYASARNRGLCPSMTTTGYAGGWVLRGQILMC